MVYEQIRNINDLPFTETIEEMRKRRHVEIRIEFIAVSKISLLINVESSLKNVTLYTKHTNNKQENYCQFELLNLNFPKKTATQGQTRYNNNKEGI